MARETRSALTASSVRPVARSHRMSMSDILRASAKVDTVGAREDSARDGNTLSSRSRAWQRDAWRYYDEVGESRYSARFIAACLSRCRLTIGLPDRRGKIGPAFDENGDPLRDKDNNLRPGVEYAEQAAEIVNALRNPVGGQPQLMADMGLNLSVAGELHLVGQQPAGATESTTDVTKLEWDVMSTDEFYPQGDDYLHRPAEGLTPQEVKGDSVHVVRLWRSHPRFKVMPDSMFMSVRDVLEELVLLTKEVRAETLSRIANSKVFGVPNEIEYPEDDKDDAEGAEGDPLTRDMMDRMVTAITDKGSAAAIAPFLLRGPQDALDHVYVWDLSPEHMSDSAAKRKEAVMRFAQGADLPVEIVTGMMGTTFANAVVIDDSLFKSHIEPILELIADGLTAGFLHPALAQLGIRDCPLVVYYDSGELVARPNRAQDAKDLHDRYALADSALRNSCGFSDNDAPDDEEIARRVQIKQLTMIRQTVKATTQGLEAETKAIETPAPAGMPLAPGAPVTQGTNTVAAALSGEVYAMVELSVEHAVARAGNRLRSYANQRQPTLRAQLAQIPGAEVPVALGPALVGKLADNEDLFHGQFDALRSLIVRRTGDQNYADAVRDAAIGIAGERLYQPRQPFPFGSVPRYEERGILAAAQ